jgi:hypothetical protein
VLLWEALLGPCSLGRAIAPGGPVGGPIERGAPLIGLIGSVLLWEAYKAAGYP